MELNEFKNRLFDVINETDNLPIQDIVVEDRNNQMKIYLTDGVRFTIRVGNCEKWCFCKI